MLKGTLITGGLGFIGSGLAKSLVKKGEKVRILTRSTNKLENLCGFENNIDLLVKDIREIKEGDLEGISHIFHLAGTVDNYSIQDGNPYRDIEINCNGTIVLLEAMKKHPSIKGLFASTFFVNGRVDELPANEKSPCNPLGLYGATRLAAEHFCKIYNEIFGLDIRIVRFSNVFGPYEQGENKKKAGFNFMIHEAVLGKELKVYQGGNFIRDYLYIDDAVRAINTVMDKGERSKIYYVGRGEGVEFKKLIRIIQDIIPDTRITSIEPPQFHKQVGIGNFYCDVSPLKRLGWKPETSLEEGIGKTIAFYRSKDF